MAYGSILRNLLILLVILILLLLAVVKIDVWYTTRRARRYRPVERREVEQKPEPRAAPKPKREREPTQTPPGAISESS